ncbi:GntR family transcriptional regulator [Sphingomonas bacterium]|uniref:GntR family transcriptional regulator n=1 Tax=Sphingomonas bacterium TaxID=1895847 RepID=UPI0015764EA8|nr:GntR family transcriptional regulator [Sphingomonas bacterium]
MTAMSSEDSPVYIRLRGTIAAGILRGDFRAGDQLPSVRALAAEHGANPLTVAKAYQSFQDEGYVEVRRGVGMFVLAGAAERLRVAERESFVTQHWPRIRAYIDLLGFDPADLLARDLAERERA